MSLMDLTSKDIRQIARLIERKEALQEQLEEINRALGNMGGASAPAEPRPAAGKSARKPARRKKAAKGSGGSRNSGRKEQIIDLLKGSGKEGLHVKEIAERIGSSKGSVNVWFYTVAKKVPNIQQTGPGRFRWVNGAKG